MNPSLHIVGQHELPEFACPDLSHIGNSWVHPISKPMAHRQSEHHFSHRDALLLFDRPYNLRARAYNARDHPHNGGENAHTEQIAINVLGNSKSFVRTDHGIVARRMLKPGSAYSYQNLLPSDMGSRIGMMFVPNPENPTEEAELHFIVNGRDQGPCEKHIPYKNLDLFAVIDVYGTTKEVRIIQLYDSNCMCWLHIPYI